MFPGNLTIILGLCFIGLMSEIFPDGSYPASSTVPAKWTDEPNQPGVVQFNGLVYVKTERHTGGTGKPNEEEVDGIRTWRLYTTNQPSTPYRYLWCPLHSVLGNFGLSKDEECYSYIESYFFLYPLQFGASNDWNVGGSCPSNLRFLIHHHPFEQDGVGSQVAASGLFESWEGTLSSPPPFNWSNFSGYASGNPDYPDIPPYVPDPVPAAEIEVIKYIYAIYPAAVGKTFTGYLELVAKDGFWAADPETGLQTYYYGTTYVAEQIPISYTVTQQNYTDTLEGNTPTLPAPDTYTAQGDVDYYVSWGRVVLTSITPNADA